MLVDYLGNITAGWTALSCYCNSLAAQEAYRRVLYAMLQSTVLGGGLASRFHTLNACLASPGLQLCFPILWIYQGAPVS